MRRQPIESIVVYGCLPRLLVCPQWFYFVWHRAVSTCTVFRYAMGVRYHLIGFAVCCLWRPVLEPYARSANRGWVLETFKHATRCVCNWASNVVRVLLYVDAWSYRLLYLAADRLARETYPRSECGLPITVERDDARVELDVQKPAIPLHWGWRMCHRSALRRTRVFHCRWRDATSPGPLNRRTNSAILPMCVMFCLENGTRKAPLSYA